MNNSISPISSYPSIKIANQYRKIFWKTIFSALCILILAFSISSLEMIPPKHEALALIIATFPLLIWVILRYFWSVRRRMICPICSKGKLDLKSLDHLHGEILIYYCPICEQNYNSDLMYKKKPSSKEVYISIIKDK